MPHARLALLALLAAMASAAASAQPAGPPAARVVVDRVREEVLARRTEVTGSVRASRRATLAAEEEGLLAELRVREGDVVGQGTLLARLDDADRVLDVRAAEAAAAAARATAAERRASRDKAARDLERLRELAERSDVVSEEAVDAAATTLAEAEARLRRADADVATAAVRADRARQDLRDTRIEAPFDAHVVARRAEVGEWLGPGDPVVEVVALSPIEVWLDVPEAHLSTLSAGRGPVWLRVPSLDRTWELAGAAILPDVDPLSRTFAVRADLDNADQALRPGMRVVAALATRPAARHLTVHADAILRDAGGERVFVDADGRARAVPVRSVFEAGGRVVVDAPGLAVGDRVVIEGNERLMDGQPVAATGG